MGAIYYFIKGVSAVNGSKIKEKGIGYVVPESGEPETMAGTLNGDSGVYFAYSGKDGKTKLMQAVKEPLEWVSINENVSCAVWEDNIPTPDELRRKNQQQGHDVSLGDGNMWCIPCARKLPCKITVKDGEWTTGDVLRKYKTFYEQAEKLWDDFVGQSGDEGAKVSFSGGVDTIVEAISMNYRIGSKEIDLLELVTTENSANCVLAIIDWDFWVEYLKKKEPVSEQQQDLESLNVGEKV